MVKKFFKNIKAKCKGFSLMELIVTIAIMAVLAAVLAPALIHYVEDSRAAKDDYAMSEVVNSVKTAMAYDDVYDEVISNIDWHKSCYVHTAGVKVEYKEPIFVDDENTYYQCYKYNDNTRNLDEVEYALSGQMYGATITFEPDKKNVIQIRDGVYSGEDSDKKISEMSDDNFLYTRIKQIIGNNIELKSSTYKNSKFTIFICFGVDGEKTKNKNNVVLSDEPVAIYGQWNGTNLANKSQANAGGDIDDNSPTSPGGGGVLVGASGDESIGNVVSTEYFATFRDAMAYQSGDSSLSYMAVGENDNPACKVDKCENGYSIVLMKDCTYEASEEQIDLNDNTVLDINGKTFTMAHPITHSETNMSIIGVAITNSKKTGCIQSDKISEVFALYNCSIYVNNITMVLNLNGIESDAFARFISANVGENVFISNTTVKILGNNINIGEFSGIRCLNVQNVNIQNSNIMAEINDVTTTSLYNCGISCYSCNKVNVSGLKTNANVSNLTSYMSFLTQECDNSSLNKVNTEINAGTIRQCYNIFVYKNKNFQLKDSTATVKADLIELGCYNISICGKNDLYTNANIDTTNVVSIVKESRNLVGLRLYWTDGSIKNTKTETTLNTVTWWEAEGKSGRSATASTWILYNNDIKIQDCSFIYEVFEAEYAYGLALTGTKNAKLSNCDCLVYVDDNESATRRGLSLQNGAIVYADSCHFRAYGPRSYSIVANGHSSQAYLSNCVLESNNGHLFMSTTDKTFIGVNNDFRAIPFKFDGYGTGCYEETNQNYAEIVQ